MELQSRVSLAADVIPKRGMHVYAPGATGYRVISLNIEPQAHVRIMPVKYPPSEIYHFVPLDERAPVYQKPFTLPLSWKMWLRPNVAGAPPPSPPPAR